MLKLRAVQLNLNGTTRCIVAKGCPQGGVLSPLLWNLVVDDLLRQLNSSGFYTVGYADDLTILISGKFENLHCSVMQAAMKIVEQWCREYRLKVNPSKTELVLFTNKRKLNNMSLPTLFGTQLTLSTEVKYLGITLDNKLNWNKHLDNKIKQATIAFWQCKRMLGKTWGLKPKLTLWLYKAVIRPTITYGSVVWWPRTELSSVKNKLQKLQRLACVAITGCMKSTPTAALEVLLDLPPLHLVVKQEAAAAAFRLRAAGLWANNSTASHTSIMLEAIKHQPMMAAIGDRIPLIHIFKRHYNIQLHEEPRDQSSIYELRIYTDGSKKTSGTGAGVHSDDLNIHFSLALSKYNTIFQAECVAITRAANAVKSRKVTNQRIRILSDSAAVLLALSSKTITSGLVLECHSALESLASQNNTITLQWIKGHSGSLGNDAADELARKGSDTAPIGPEPIVPIPFNQIRSWLRSRTTECHTNLWSNSAECKQTKAFVPLINTKLTRKLLCLDRANLRVVISTITGHCRLNKHLYRMKISTTPLCRSCMEEDETASHVLLHCKGVETIRSKILGSPGSLREVMSNLGRLLAFWRELGWLNS
ncbi:hypothetical protein JYU34_007191 [Plutella xylostella]|uniref:Uncharacterized protein n=1 Tax=Plutella xylostella TaxID=51655 RepID=A0ABQ7QPV9_PLUXY|nr:hypothetical protein JYU34_007191 [Plutella xylostella]